MNSTDVSMSGRPYMIGRQGQVDAVLESKSHGVEEGVSLRGPAGQKLGVVPWALVAPYLDEDPRREAVSSSVRPTTSTGIDVHYCTSDGQEYQGVARRVESATVYIEGRTLLPPGTAVEVRGGGGAGEVVSARGVVMWVCPKRDQYGFARGMAVWASAMPERFRDLFEDPAM